MTAYINLAVKFSGGLGDMIVATPFLYALHEIINHQKFDLFIPQPAELARDIYYQAPFINNMLPGEMMGPLAETYDGIILVDELVLYRVNATLADMTPALMTIINRGIEHTNEFGLPLTNQPHLNNQLANHAVFWGLDRRSLQLYSAGLEQRDTTPTLHLNPAHFPVLDKYGLRDTPYITIHDGWDGSFPLADGKRFTKVWLPHYWDACVQLLKAEFPGLKIVQLGSLKNGNSIAGVDLNLRGQTSIAESLVILKHSAQHVDTESGLVHLARALHTPCVCMIGPTNAKFFGYARHTNLVSNLCTNCWWIKADWMENCLRGLDPPECMSSLSPQLVFETVKAALQQPQFVTYSVSATAPVAAAGHTVAVFHNPAAATAAAQQGATVIHYADQLENIHRPNDLPYRQQAAQIFNIPAENAYFDHLVFDAALLTAGTLFFAVKEALRVLRPGGYLHLSLPGHHTNDWATAAALLNITAPFSTHLIIHKHAPGTT